MDIFGRIFRRSSSASVAKRRLQLVLIQDRTNISPETLNILKDEMVALLSKYIEIDRENVEVSITSGDEGSRLTANIPVIGTRRTPSRPASLERP